jgi:membrane protease YdiL (CAAX protease family)
VAEGYLRVARGGAWWRLLCELLLAPIWWLVGAAVAGATVLGIAGAKKLSELDIIARLVLTHVTIAIITPAALLAAMVIGRRPGFLLSVAGKIRWRWLARCLVLAAATQLTLVIAGIVLELVTTGALDSLAHGGSRLWQVLVVTLCLVPFQATGEEVFTRGTLQQVLGGWGAPAWVAIVVSTGVFVAMHGTPNVGTIVIAAMGFSCAWLTLETGGLEAAIAGHVINNIVAFTLAALAHGTDALDPQKLNERVGITSVLIQLAIIATYTALVLRSWRRTTQTTT